MINLNGNILASPKILDVENRGLQYGDALFETLKCSGGKVLFWEDHYFRLMASMRILRMEIPMSFTMEFLLAEIEKVISKEEHRSYRIKILVWRKPGGKYTPHSSEVEYAVTADEIPYASYQNSKDYYEVELYKDHYVAPGLLSSVKSNNRLINILGGIYAEENGFENCLLLNVNKNVVEFLNGNIFLVKDKVIKTPPVLDGCINGIIRKQLISIIKKEMDLQIVEQSISPFELQNADEMLLTNIIIGIQPISQYRKKKFEANIAERLLEKLNLKAQMDLV